MLTMNRATVLGYAGRNPEMRRLQSGGEVALLSLATNERFTRRDGSGGETTDWHAVVAFGSAAETVRKLVRKGDPVLVEGRMVSRSWTDRTGTEHRTTEILVSGPRGRVNVLSRRKPEPGDDPPSGGAKAGAAEPGRTEAVAAGDGAGATAADPSSETDAPGSPATSEVDAAEPVGADTAPAGKAAASAGCAGAASAGPSSGIEAGPGDAASSDDATAPAAATRPDAAEVADTGDDAGGAPASGARDSAAEDAGSDGAGRQANSEGTAAGAGPAAVPVDTTGETGGAPGTGSLPAAEPEQHGAAEAERENSPAQGNTLVQGNTLFDRHA